MLTLRSRQIYVGLMGLVLLSLLAQFFLAGLGAFGSDAGFDPHEQVGFISHTVAVLLLVLAALGRIGWRLGLITLAWYVLFTVQIMLPGISDDSPEVAALHPVNALVILFGAYHLMRAVRAITVEPMPEPTPAT